MLVRVLGRRGAAALCTDDGFRLNVPLSDTGVVGAALQGELFEPAVRDVMRATIRPGDLVVDGGAHIGWYTLIAAARVGDRGRVVAFEPHPSNCALLRRTICDNGLDGRVVVREEALGECGGRATFTWSPAITTHGSLEPSTVIEGRRSFVSVVALDDVLGEGDEARLLKLDLEGGEPAALQGMKRTLRQADLLIMEVNRPRLQSLNLDPSEVIGLALELGCFSTVDLLPIDGGRPSALEGLERELDKFEYANVAFGRRSLR